MKINKAIIKYCKAKMRKAEAEEKSRKESQAWWIIRQELEESRRSCKSERKTMETLDKLFYAIFGDKAGSPNEKEEKRERLRAEEEYVLLKRDLTKDDFERIFLSSQTQKLAQEIENRRERFWRHATEGKGTTSDRALGRVKDTIELEVSLGLMLKRGFILIREEFKKNPDFIRMPKANERTRFIIKSEDGTFMVSKRTVREYMREEN